MYRKKFSGQRLAIIILIVLLLLSIVFSVVYIYFNTRKAETTGRVVLGALNIKIDADVASSGNSNMTVFSSRPLKGGDSFENTAMVVNNASELDMYLVVVYEVTARNIFGSVADPMTYNILDFKSDYYNPTTSDTRFKYIETTAQASEKNEFIDYVFASDKSGSMKYYRCLVSLKKHKAPAGMQNEIVVIPENSLGLSLYIGDEYQSSTMSFKFQAYAISAEGDAPFNTRDEVSKQCQDLVEAVYKSQSYNFLNHTV